MKLLNGKELAEFIQERQAREVRALRQAHGIAPKLAIVVTVDNPIINVYMRMKKAYGEEMLIDVDIHAIELEAVAETIARLNADTTVHGIIVQLPLSDPKQTETVVNLVAPEKDIDGLGKNPAFDPATPMAIQWLLAGYNVDLRGKSILLIGRGRLVGAPLERILSQSGLAVTVADRETPDLKQLTLEADVIITAAGSPAILYPGMVKSGVVIVDAGVASEKGKTVGDVAAEMYDRDDITITPPKGGVGPLTVCTLFENVIRAAKARVNEAAEN